VEIAVIGAGLMGQGIVLAFASNPDNKVSLAGYRSKDSALAAIDKIAKRLARSVEKGRMDEAKKKAILGSIKAVERRDVGKCDLVVESVQEDMATKKAIFQELDGICQSSAIFATNTSSLSITEIGRGLSHELIGMHFFNPADVMKLVEVVRGISTSDALVEKIKQLAQSIGKVPVEVKEGPGFMVNRMLIPMINEAVEILAEGLATPADIDTAMKLGANHPMGPLALADLIGLDIVLAIMEVLQRETGDPKYRASPFLRKMVRGGLLGQKTGQGFFVYTR